jgi:ribosomal protein L12E/L44/L45/RPP1/RPP2
MKTIAAALLVALSGKPVTEEAIKAIFKSVGAKENAAEIKSVVDALKGKKPEDVVAEGLKKLVSVAPAGGEHHEEEHHDDKKKDDKKGGKDKGGKDKGKKEEKKKVEKKEEEEEDDIGLGGLF